jgi:hypothetical protein
MGYGGRGGAHRNLIMGDQKKLHTKPSYPCVLPNLYIPHMRAYYIPDVMVCQ